MNNNTKLLPLFLVFGALLLAVVIFGINWFFRFLPALMVFSLGSFLVHRTILRLKINLSILYPISISILFLYLYAFTWSETPSPFIGLVIFLPYILALLLFLFSFPYNHFRKSKDSPSNN